MPSPSHNFYPFTEQVVVISTADFSEGLISKLTNDPVIQSQFGSDSKQVCAVIYEEMVHQLFEIMDSDLNIFWTSLTIYPVYNRLYRCQNANNDPSFKRVLKSVMDELALFFWNRLRDYGLLDGHQVYPKEIRSNFVFLGVVQHALLDQSQV